MKKLLLLIVFSSVFLISQAQIYRPEGVNIPGAWCNWSNPPTKLVFAGDSQRTGGLVHYITDHNKRYHATFYIDTVAGADTTAGTYAFLFTSGPSTNYWLNKWANTTVIFDSLQPYSYQGNTDNSISVTNGSWYTVNFEDKGYGNSRAIFMRTSQKPVTIDSVSHPGAYVLKSQPPTIQIFLSDTPSSEEIVYLRYTKDGWKTSSLITANLNGMMAGVQMPGFNQGDTIQYYIFTSTKSNIPGDFGLYTLNYLLNPKKYIVTNKLASISWVSGTVLCPGGSFDVAYQSVSGYNQGNTMTIWISDSAGSFNNALAIGSKTTISDQDTIICTMPSGLLSSGYQIILTSDAPADTSNIYGSAFSIKSLPQAHWLYNGSQKLCEGDSIRLNIQSGAGYQYQWRKNGVNINGAVDSIYYAADSATYDVIVTNSCGSDTTNALSIQLYKKPQAVIQTGGINSFCYGDSTNLYVSLTGNHSYQWSEGNNKIAGANDSFLTVYNTGSYSIMVTDTGSGCFTESSPVSINAINCNIIYSPEGINIPGTWNGWTNAPSNKPVFASSRQVKGGMVTLNRLGTRRYSTRFHIDSINADTSAGKYNFLFTSGPASNYWQNKWGDVIVIMDSLQRYNFKGNADNEINVANGNWYTVNFEDMGYQSTRGIFMETPQEPVTIDTVYQNPNVVYADDSVMVSFELSGKPSNKEFFFVRYSSDKWSTSRLLPATLQGSTGQVTIPATNKTDTINYYIFSSTKPNVYDNFDLYTLELNNNNGKNYTYVSYTKLLQIDSITNTVLCAGDSMLLYYSTVPMSPSNHFSVELSDLKGSFSNPKILKTWQGTGSGKTYITIPNIRASGPTYKIRILSSSPQLTSQPYHSDLTIKESPSDSIRLTGNGSICQGDSIKLTAESGIGFLYEWFQNGNKISNDSFIYTSTAGKYYVNIYATNGCITKTNDAEITVFNGKPKTVINANGSTTFCVGGSVKLYVSKIPGETYQWRFNFADILGANDSFIQVSQTGSYEISVTNGCGSTLFGPTVVYANPLPLVSLTGKSNICTGESTYYSTFFDSVYTYQWYKNDTAIAGATIDSLFINAEGKYSVVVTNPFGCIDTATKQLMIDPDPDATVSFSGPARYCPGKTISLNAINGYQFYQWYLNDSVIIGANNSTYGAFQAGTYKVKVITSIGCSSMTQNPVYVSANPIPSKPLIAANGSILTSTYANTYQWLRNSTPIPGATNKSYNTSYLPGNYTVLTTDSNGCEAISNPYEVIGISELNHPGSIELYPNPTSGILYIEHPGIWRVMDLSGKIMNGIQESKNDRTRMIDLSNLPAGIYIIQIDDRYFKINLIK